VSWRARGGLRLQGGTSTGRQVQDNCRVLVDNPSPRNCHVAFPFQTNVRGSASYVVPWVDVLVSTIFQYRPGVQRSANLSIACPGFVCPSDVFQWAPGSVSDATGLPRTTITGFSQSLNNNSFNVLDTGTLYGEGYTTFDFKLAKVVRFAGTRTNIGFDIYNAFNSDAAIGYQNTYPGGNFNGQFVAWGAPTSIVTPRFARISLQFDF
jgi:hypothetical protein